MLNRLAAETTDENWKPSQVDGDDTSVHKVCVGGTDQKYLV